VAASAPLTLPEIPPAHGSEHPHLRQTSPSSAEYREALLPSLVPLASPLLAAALALSVCVSSTQPSGVSSEPVWSSVAPAWAPPSPDQQSSAASPDTQIPRRELTLDKTRCE